MLRRSGRYNFTEHSCTALHLFKWFADDEEKRYFKRKFRRQLKVTDPLQSKAARCAGLVTEFRENLKPSDNVL